MSGFLFATVMALVVGKVILATELGAALGEGQLVHLLFRRRRSLAHQQP